MFNAKAYLSGSSAFKGLWENKSFLLVCLVILLGQFLIVTFGGEMFDVVPLSFESWAVIIASTSVVLWIGELLRLLGKKR